MEQASGKTIDLELVVCPWAIFCCSDCTDSLCNLAKHHRTVPLLSFLHTILVCYGGAKLPIEDKLTCWTTPQMHSCMLSRVVRPWVTRGPVLILCVCAYMCIHPFYIHMISKYLLLYILFLCWVQIASIVHCFFILSKYTTNSLKAQLFPLCLNISQTVMYKIVIVWCSLRWADGWGENPRISIVVTYVLSKQLK